MGRVFPSITVQPSAPVYVYADRKRIYAHELYLYKSR